VIKSSVRLPLMGLIVLVAAGVLLASSGRLRGIFVSRGSTEPVFISRSGGAGGEAQVVPPDGPSLITGPTLVTVTAGTVDASVDLCNLPRTKPNPKPILPEFEVEAEELRKMIPFEDAAAQPAASGAAPGPNMPAPIQNFDGLNFNDWGAGFPPDTNGDVGPNHYVQTVNTSVGIYSKTGTELCAFTFDDLFGAATVLSGTPCDANNNGDPIVLYDAEADRWIVTDFAWTNNDNGPYYECIAASKGANPVNSGWWLYALRADDASHNFLNDYPKLGVWPDGIYMAANMYDCNNNCGAGTTYEGSRAWALNRSDMYSGATLRTIVFDVDTNAFTMLPSNYRGPTPPTDTPNYFVANDLSEFKLNVYKFTVDFAIPANSTFTGPTEIAVGTYSSPPDTIPVLNGNNLDSLGTRLMMQNQYRNRSGTESLWLSHTAGKASPNIAGLRWYQLDVSGGAIDTTPVQESTFRPDSKHRWIPSIAVDQDGNMAIGYSVADASQFAAIEYTGRLASDPLNTVSNAVGLLIAGGGAQNNNCGGPCERWGDYATMSVDPLDDCTFWFTTEYYAASGSDWHTRIGSFKFPSCGAPVTTYEIHLPTVLRIAGAAPAWQNLTQEGFEGAFPSTGWGLSEFGSDEFLWAATNCRAFTGTKSGWGIGGGAQGSGLSCGNNYPDDAYSWLTFGPFSLADATAAEFRMQVWVETELDIDGACRMASIDNFNFHGICTTGSTSGVFEPRVLDLASVPNIGNLLGQPSVWVAMVFSSDQDVNLPEGAHVDDMVVRKCVVGGCPAQQSPAAPESSRLVEKDVAFTRP
jgi:hypothetical protein